MAVLLQFFHQRGVLKLFLLIWQDKLCLRVDLVSEKVKVSVSHVQLFETPWTVARQTPLSWNSPGKNIGEGSHSLLQGIFPTQGSNSGLLYCRLILYCLSHTLLRATCNNARSLSFAIGVACQNYFLSIDKGDKWCLRVDLVRTSLIIKSIWSFPMMKGHHIAFLRIVYCVFCFFYIYIFNFDCKSSFCIRHIVV